MSFEVLKGKTIKEIGGAEVGNDVIEIETTDGDSYQMYHSQDCCESVRIEDIAGDVSDLIGTPILLAEKVTSDSAPDEVKAKREYEPESETWTFYKLSTIKGSVTIRWCGTSNGYYSESVTFEKK